MRGGNCNSPLIFAFMAKKAYLLLGSNMGSRAGRLLQAIQAINEQAGRVVKVSGLYETEPWGIAEQEAFLNCAVELETNLAAEELLATLLAIEIQLGRTREVPKYGPRVIDIDIILFEDEVVDTPTLTLPHPAMAQRMFTLIPLVEIAADAIHPGYKKTIKQLLDECTDELKVFNVGKLEWQSKTV